MIFELGIILIVGVVISEIIGKMGLPKLLGMLVSGIILGPNALGILTEEVLNISPELRKIALIIILIRAGLNLDISALKQVGRPAILMCFIPALFEIGGILIISPIFFDITYAEALLIGTVVAAVSPAVIVPRMIKFLDEGYSKNIVQTVLAGATVDDIFVIVLFAVMTGVVATGETQMLSLVKIPTSVILGVLVGVIIGIALVWLFKKLRMRDSIKVVIFLGISFLLVTVEDKFTQIIGFSGLLCIMTFSAVVKQKYKILAERLSAKFSSLWIFAEIVLFVLVGAEINIKFALNAGMFTVILILLALLIRMLGVFSCFAFTKFPMRERMFAAISYLPKATVQAAIGTIPLSMGLECGELVLTIAVLSIIITAPLGAVFIDKYADKLLEKH